MFVIASSGRCGTLALTTGLSLWSDHTVRHEPEPTLLREALLKHRGEYYRSPALREKILTVGGSKYYGESFRAAPLVEDMLSALPSLRVVVLVRHPEAYVRSAHAMRVLERGDEWDANRIFPPGVSDDEPLAVRLAAHWRETNRYLLRAAETNRDRVTVLLASCLENQITRLEESLEIIVEDKAALELHLRQRPNSAGSRGDPTGFERVASDEAVWRIWDQAVAIACG